MARFVQLCAVGLIMGGMAACDQYPLVNLRNETDLPIDLHLSDRTEAASGFRTVLRIEPHKSSTFPAGYLVSTDATLVTGGCAAQLRGLGDEQAIAGGYGARTELAIDSDLRVRVVRRGVPPRVKDVDRQPPGWPLQPVSKTCR